MPQQFQQAEEAIGLSPDIDEPEETEPGRHTAQVNRFVASGEFVGRPRVLSRVGQHVSFNAVAVRIFSKNLPRAFRRRYHDYMADLPLSVQRRRIPPRFFDFQGKADLVVRVKTPDLELFDLAFMDDIYSASQQSTCFSRSFEIRCPSRTASRNCLSGP